ncbi:MAG: hypothetical protein WDO16_08835 [Bacteroidota bacterium]
MYELVKKKNNAIKIIYGILILFVISSLLKFFLSEPRMTISDELMRMASELNKHAPVIIDSTTRFDNAIALPGYRIQYNYTILNAQKSDIDTVLLSKANKEFLLNKIKTNPKAAFFLENRIDILATYSDTTGAYICTITLSHDEYK